MLGDLLSLQLAARAASTRLGSKRIDALKAKLGKPAKDPTLRHL